MIVHRTCSHSWTKLPHFDKSWNCYGDDRCYTFKNSVDQYVNINIITCPLSTVSSTINSSPVACSWSGQIIITKLVSATDHDWHRHYFSTHYQPVVVSYPEIPALHRSISTQSIQWFLGSASFVIFYYLVLIQLFALHMWHCAFQEHS